MGGIGYITSSLAEISKNNILINAHMLDASKQNGNKKLSVLVLRLRLRWLQAEDGRSRRR